RLTIALSKTQRGQEKGGRGEDRKSHWGCISFPIHHSPFSVGRAAPPRLKDSWLSDFADWRTQNMLRRGELHDDDVGQIRTGSRLTHGSPEIFIERIQ